MKLKYEPMENKYEECKGCTRFYDKSLLSLKCIFHRNNQVKICPCLNCLVKTMCSKSRTACALRNEKCREAYELNNKKIYELMDKIRKTHDTM